MPCNRNGPLTFSMWIDRLWLSRGAGARPFPDRQMGEGRRTSSSTHSCRLEFWPDFRATMAAHLAGKSRLDIGQTQASKPRPVRSRDRGRNAQGGFSWRRFHAFRLFAPHRTRNSVEKVTLAAELFSSNTVQVFSANTVQQSIGICRIPCVGSLNCLFLDPIRFMIVAAHHEERMGISVGIHDDR
ncbi:hypothetical protein V1278_002511 [Bradyrhizobium sp. AZCC 1577]